MGQACLIGQACLMGQGRYCTAGHRLINWLSLKDSLCLQQRLSFFYAPTVLKGIVKEVTIPLY